MNSKFYHILFLFVRLYFSINTFAQNMLTQNDCDHATQILNELLPNENYFVTETGVRDKDFGMVVEFSVNKQLDRSVIIIAKDYSKFEMCCLLGMEEDENGTMNDYYYSTSSFSFLPNQLDRLNELKAILDKIIKE